MSPEQKVYPADIDRSARTLVDSLRTGAGWRKEHGRIQRTTIIREDASELESARMTYERAAEILLEQGYAARFHCRPHDPESGCGGYVQLAICIGR